MGWTAGRFMITQGASVTIEFNWQDKYKGTQFARARPLLNLGPFLGSVSGERTLKIVGHGLTARNTGETTDWIYHVTVQNPHADVVVFFELAGGDVQPDAA
jgi:hypothetical protein